MEWVEEELPAEGSVEDSEEVLAEACAAERRAHAEGLDSDWESDLVSVSGWAMAEVFAACLLKRESKFC